MTDPALFDKIQRRIADSGVGNKIVDQQQIERVKLTENVKRMLEVLPLGRSGGTVNMKSKTFNIGLVLQPMKPPPRAPVKGQTQEVLKFLIRISTWTPLLNDSNEQKAIMATKFLASVAFSSVIDVLAPVQTTSTLSLRKMSAQKSVTTTEAMAVPRQVSTEVCFTYEIVKNSNSTGKTEKIVQLLSDNTDVDEEFAVEKLLTAILQSMLTDLGYFDMRFCGRKSLDCAGRFSARNIVSITYKDPQV